MTPRRKRLLVVLGILGGVGASVSLAVMASRNGDKKTTTTVIR